MLRASVLIPTHEHAATLPFAVKSVQSQGIDAIEILIVGDGVDDTLRAVIERLCTDDGRIRFFDFPKGPRHGEIHRDAVLRQARGRIVCYQATTAAGCPGTCRRSSRHWTPPTLPAACTPMSAPKVEFAAMFSIRDGQSSGSPGSNGHPTGSAHGPVTGSGSLPARIGWMPICA